MYHAQVMLRYCQGAAIQHRPCYNADSWEWKDTEFPVWDWLSWEYRVKPER